MDTLIGEGSYGKVYRDHKNSASVFKEIKLWIHDTTNHDQFVFIENNFKELIFYQLLFLFYKQNYSNFSLSFLFNIKFTHILIPDKIEVHNNVAKIYFENRGTILNDIKFTSLNQFNQIFKQLSQTIYELFDSNITHGDLKPTNVLIKNTNGDNSLQVTLIDFGSICFFHNINITQPYQRCTIIYISPEELIEQKYSIANDWWSLGVIMFEFITEKSFIPSLMVFYKLNSKSIQQFIDEIFYNKKTKDFDSKQYLTLFIKKLKQKHIDYFIESQITPQLHSLSKLHMKDDDITQLKSLIKYLLTIDKIERINNKNHIIKYFNLELILNEYINYANVDLERFKHLTINSYTESIRKGFIEIIYYLCSSKKIKKFGMDIFAHSIMLLDRFFIKLDINTLPKSINYPVICILCVCISAILLKGEYFRSKEIVQMIEQLFEITISHSDIEMTLIFFIKQMNYGLFNISPDLLINSNINYNQIYKVLQDYSLLNENSLALYELLTSE
jgi:serine/threonine protein kinase